MQFDSWGCSTRTAIGPALQPEALSLEVEALARQSQPSRREVHPAVRRAHRIGQRRNLDVLGNLRERPVDPHRQGSRVIAGYRWGSFALLEELRTQVAVLDDGLRLRSAFVAATILTATRCGVASPSGRISFEFRNLSSFGWVSSGKSPISSRCWIWQKPSKSASRLESFGVSTHRRLAGQRQSRCKSLVRSWFQPRGSVLGKLAPSRRMAGKWLRPCNPAISVLSPRAALPGASAPRRPENTVRTPHAADALSGHNADDRRHAGWPRCLLRGSRPANGADYLLDVEQLRSESKSTEALGVVAEPCD